MQHKNSKKARIVIEKLGEVVRKKRELLGKSQRLLADEYGIERTLVCRIEKALNEPKLISVFTIAEILGLKPSELIAEVEKHLPEDFSLIEQ